MRVGFRPTQAVERVVQVELSGRLAAQEREIIEAALRESQGLTARDRLDVLSVSKHHMEVLFEHVPTGFQ
jgi:hypothetical protein